MRWDDVFADLEAQLDAAERAVWDADVAELARAERAAVRLVDRLAVHTGALALGLAGGRWVDGHLADLGDGWLRLATATGDVLVPLGAVRAVTGLGRGAAPPHGLPVPTRRLSLASVLRALVRRRCVVRLSVADADDVTGTLDAVLADHLELAVHPLDVPRRTANVGVVQAIPLAAVVCVTVPPG